ncbi:hypothetical protein ACFL2V_18230 [Pseudomonadota bacterium]
MNKPLQEVMKDSETVRVNSHGTCRIVKKEIRPLVLSEYEFNNPKYNARCNPNLNSPHLTMVVLTNESSNYSYKKGQQYFIRVGYGYRWTEHISSYNPKTKIPKVKTIECGRGENIHSSDNYLSPPIFRNKNYFHQYTTMMQAPEIRQKFIAKGVPFSYCYQNDYKKTYGDSIYTHKNTHCLIDWYYLKLSGGYEMHMVPSFSISTMGLTLSQISLNQLNIAKDEEHLSLADIYNKRLQDQINAVQKAHQQSQ